MTIISWIIFFGILLGLVGVTWWSRRFVKDVAGFLVAGRKIGMWLGLSTSFSGGLGLVSIAFTAQQGFVDGLAFIWVILAQSIVAAVIFGVFGFGIQRLRASKAMTAGQYHEMRFSRGVRLLVGVVCGIGGVLNMAVFPITGAKFLTYFLSWPLSFSWMGMEMQTLPLLTGGMILLAIFFAVVCGQVGVLITDYLQSIVIGIGLFGVIFLIFKNVGISTIQQTLEQNLGDAAFNPMVTSTYGWQWLLWVVVMAVTGPFCFGPAMSRNASATNTKVVRLTALISAFLGNGKIMLMLVMGVGAFVVLGATVPEGMTSLQYNLVATPIFIQSLLGPVMMGIVLGALLAAFISTNDSYFLSWSSIWVNDVLIPLLPKPLSVRAHLWALRIAVVLIGLFLYLFGVFYTLESTVLEFIMLTGTIWLGCGIALIFGLYWKRASTAGAYGAILTAMFLPILHLILQKAVPGYIEVVSAKLAGLVTIGVSATSMVILSLFSQKPTRFVDYSEVVRNDEAHGIRYQGEEA